MPVVQVEHFGHLVAGRLVHREIVIPFCFVLFHEPDCLLPVSDCRPHEFIEHPAIVPLWRLPQCLGKCHHHTGTWLR